MIKKLFLYMNIDSFTIDDLPIAISEMVEFPMFLQIIDYISFAGYFFRQMIFVSGAENHQHQDHYADTAETH